MFKRFLKKLLKESMLLRVQESNESFSAKFVLIIFSVKVDLKSYNFCCILVQNSIDSSGTKISWTAKSQASRQLGSLLQRDQFGFLGVFCRQLQFQLYSKFAGWPLCLELNENNNYKIIFKS